MGWLWFIVKVVLFVAYVPGVLFRIVPSQSARVQALAHGLLYAVVLALLYQFVFHVERMTNPSTKTDSACPAGSHKCPSGDCVLDGDKHSPCH